MKKPAPEQEVRFLVNLQRLLAEGQFVSTYKYALLMALADIAVENGDDSEATLQITSAQLADKFVRYYWRQSAPYPVSESRNGAVEVFRQNAGREAGIIRAVRQARGQFQGSLASLRHRQRLFNPLPIQSAMSHFDSPHPP
jgi:hypothetical protein